MVTIFLEEQGWGEGAIRKSGLVKIQNPFVGFPGGTVVESPPADAGDTGSCPHAAERLGP